MKTGVKVLDAMTNRPITAKEANTLKECANLMKKYHVGSLLIKKGKDTIGIVTEQDIVRKAVSKALDYDTPISKVMEKDLRTIEPEKDIYDALIFMKDANIRHLPVEHDGKIIGLITLKDILKIEPQLFELLLEKFELREEQNKPIAETTGEEGVCEVCGNFSYRIMDVEGVRQCPNCRSQG